MHMCARPRPPPSPPACLSVQGWNLPSPLCCARTMYTTPYVSARYINIAELSERLRECSLLLIACGTKTNTREEKSKVTRSTGSWWKWWTCRRPSRTMRTCQTTQVWPLTTSRHSHILFVKTHFLMKDDKMRAVSYSGQSTECCCDLNQW